MASSSRSGETPALQRSLSDTERTTARYLFAVSILSDGSGDRVATGELREYLDVTPASVSGMVAKLDDRGLVDHEKYQGVRLTEEGRDIAEQVAWRVCLVSSFFDSVLDTAVDDRTAFEIGFALPRDGVVRLRELVNASCLDFCPGSGHAHDRCPA